jgi:hypothetical protein
MRNNMTMDITLGSDKKITGTGMDGNRTFTWAGSFAGNKLQITKLFENGESEVYQGAVVSETDGNATKVDMDGTWSITGSGSGGFHMVETTSKVKDMIGTCDVSTTTTAFTVGVGAGKTLIFTQQPPLTADSSDSFTVSAKLYDVHGNQVTDSSKRAYLAIEGADPSALNATALNTTLGSGAATFNGVTVQAGKDMKLFISLDDGTFNISTQFKSTAVPAHFSHTLTGLTEETWLMPEVQLSYRETVANFMGSSVTHEDVNITGYTVLQRRSSGINVNHSVALTNSSQASNSVSGLENATNSGDFVNHLKSNAASKGVALPTNLAGSGVTGTTSSQVAAAIDAKEAKAYQSATTATSSDGKQGWEITAVVFMCLTAVALVALTVLSIKWFKNSKAADPSDFGHASQIGQGRSVVHRDTPLELDDINEADDAIVSQQIDDGAYGEALDDDDDGRHRADSSTTVRVTMNVAASEGAI